jgi:hypothetical protein
MGFSKSNRSESNNYHIKGIKEIPPFNDHITPDSDDKYGKEKYDGPFNSFYFHRYLKKIMMKKIKGQKKTFPASCDTVQKSQAHSPQQNSPSQW